MGCGASRLNANGEALPARLGPLFRRRIEDIKRCRHVTLKDDTPSKKELLLVDGREEDENSNSQSLDDNTRKSVSSSPNKSITPLKDGLEKESTKAKDDDEEREEKETHIAAKDVEEEGKVENHTDEEGEEEEDDERLLSNEEGELIFPGSPSFRVYFIDNVDHDDKNDDNEFFEGKNEPSILKSEIGNDASPKLEDPVTKKVKKGRKRRSFRRVIPKGGKNLLNVRSCYISACAPHGHTRLVTEKAHA